MPETNGHQDNESRLDRIEAAIDQIVNEHERLIDEHKRLLTAQVVMVDSVARMSANIEASIDRFVEKSAAADEALGRRLDAFIEASDRNSREFHDRLNRLENRN